LTIFIFLADSDNDQESAAGVQKNSPRQLAGRRLSSFNLFTFFADKDRGSKLSIFCIPEQQAFVIINYLGVGSAPAALWVQIQTSLKNPKK
jgi:hypothetical protein